MHCAHLIAHTYIGVHFHAAWLVPSPLPAPNPLPHIAVDTLLGLTLKAVYSETIKGPLGINLVGQGNDSGWIVPHICIPPNNGLVPLHIALGGSKPMFSASTVQIDCQGQAKPTAAVLMPFIPLGQNQACSDPCNFPLDFVISPNNVLVGLTLGDIFVGLVSIAIDSAVSGLFNFGMGKFSKFASAKIASKVSSEAFEAFTSRFGAEASERIMRTVADEGAQLAARAAGEALSTGVGGYIGNLLGDAVSGAAAEPVQSAGGAIDASAGSTPVHRAD